MQIAVEAVVFLAALRRWLRGEPGAEPWRAKTSLSVAAASDQSQNNFGKFAKIKVGSARIRLANAGKRLISSLLTAQKSQLSPRGQKEKPRRMPWLLIVALIAA
ncbi:hypothetical protein ACOTH0_26160 [Achromobacter xylosoxidans]|uniref:hypothetical protein n=1 Tax=Alcaligenes xylosoxydans xylosoxydans TaxID=85698 RepID=UPI001040E54F|nr:hypothetical protein [Achromobacter xylosoxidans]NEV05045.1 hypothetical protein [Achromobacter xylosoxidans]